MRVRVMLMLMLMLRLKERMGMGLEDVGEDDGQSINHLGLAG